MNTPINSATSLVGLLGRPVRHSLSPAIHNRAFEEAGLNWAYLSFDVVPADLGAALKGSRALGMKGLNLTHPHKQAAVALLDRLGAEAAAIGAVNTVVFEASGATGRNTDAAGFSAALREEGFGMRGRQVVLLGAGGAGRAVAWAAAGDGASGVAVADLDPDKPLRLCRDLQPLFPSVVFTVAGPGDELNEALTGADLVVNATPVGMRSGDSAVIPARLLSRAAWFMDLIYHPRRTATLKEVLESGRKGLNGMGMLVHQAAAAWEIWTGKKAPLAAMRAAAETAASGERVRFSRKGVS